MTSSSLPLPASATHVELNTEEEINARIEARSTA
ncbi:MAG: hypothetical protein JWO89_1564, partial [Verrucomicrobiaceae bacterium]|nr:hypothetical protein [Verrucomicrobiaceae bacterium]